MGEGLGEMFSGGKKVEIGFGGGKVESCFDCLLGFLGFRMYTCFRGLGRGGEWNCGVVKGMWLPYLLGSYWDFIYVMMESKETDLFIVFFLC